jgi:hypothetical protein
MKQKKKINKIKYLRCSKKKNSLNDIDIDSKYLE